MKNGYHIIDADGHLMPPPTLWQEYIDPKFRDRIALDAGNHLLVDGQPTTRVTDSIIEALRFTPDDMVRRFGDMAKANFDAKSVVSGMDVEGVDMCITYDHLYAMWVDGIDPALSAALTRAYNRWFTEFTADSNGRIRGAAPLPIYDVDLALAEMEFAWDLGMRAFWVRPNPVNGKMLGDKSYDKLYSALEERDAPLSLHEGLGAMVEEAGADRFSTFLELHTCCHPHELQMAMLHMMMNGVFDRHPKLKVAFMESGCSWLPYWLWRMDEHVELVGWKEASKLKGVPTDYFKNNCYISVEPEEGLVKLVIDAIGDDNIVFSTDFPHPDSAYPHAVDTFLALPGVSNESFKKILFDNPVKFYGLDAAALAV